jgi:hypothetical protein
VDALPHKDIIENHGDNEESGRSIDQAAELSKGGPLCDTPEGRTDQAD